MGNLPAKNTVLDNRVKHIKSIYQKMVDREKAHWSTQLEDAITIGGELAACKAALDHGEWQPFCKANFPFSMQSSVRFMKAYAEKDKLTSPTVGDLVAEYGWSRVVDSIDDLKKFKLEEDEAVEAEVVPEPKQIPHKPSTTTKPAVEETDEYTEKLIDINVKKTLKPAGARWRDVIEEKVVKAIEEGKLAIAIDNSLDSGADANANLKTEIESATIHYDHLSISVQIKWTKGK